MLWKKLIEKPFLALGVLLMVVFLSDLTRRGIIKQSDFQTYACKGALTQIKNNIPSFWEASCEKNNMAVEIDYLRSDELMEIDRLPSKESILKYAYRSLANHLSFISKHSQPDIMERVHIIRVRLLLPQVEINAITEGKDIAALAQLSTPKNITSLLKERVQVQEIWKQ